MVIEPNAQPDAPTPAKPQYRGKLAFAIYLLDHLDELDTIEAILDAIIAAEQGNTPAA